MEIFTSEDETKPSGKDVTEYDQLAKINKNFEPYYNMWNGIDNWMRWHENWMKDPVLSIDAEKMEKDTETMYRMLNK